MCFFTFFTFIWVFVIIFIISIKLSIEWNSYYFYYLTRTLICENILNPLPTSKYWRVHWWNLILHYYQVFIHYFLYSQSYSYVSLFIFDIHNCYILVLTILEICLIKILTKSSCHALSTYDVVFINRWNFSCFLYVTTFLESTCKG